ncbi:MAG: hypothetical protein AVDCRST_MAG50-295 [uncultured Acidimicrobiales bacterium]|uniref:Aminoglycoside phosphotransferase domain-containing protein n=1 Tax=uncultured Acidimicrobiales bacterium TaxID=310071 RepID=A0A6J4HAS8_9ACTN|nr:MAG: hypothetical protein AVDCRST_MAG50-295 [uncultured Acidimicrobiales bacterium]
MPSSTARARRALSQWDLVEDFGIERTALGTMNEVFVVGRTRQSPQLILRGHRHLDPRLVAFEHEVMATALRAGTPAPRSIRTRDGTRFATLEGRHWSLLEWLPGEHAGRGHTTVSQAASMGEALGVVHAGLAALPCDASASDARETTETTVERIGHLLRTLGSLEVKGPDEHAAESWLRGQRAWLEHCGDAPLPERGDSQVIHGDYHDANVLFRGDAISGIIDWDKAGVGSPGGEVIRAIHLSFGLEAHVSRAFLDGYRRHRTMTTEDLDAAAVRYGYGRDRSIWLLDELYTSGNERLRRLVNRQPFLPFARSWDALRTHL